MAWHSIFRPVVRDMHEYRLFIAKITMGSVVAALAFDIVLQLVILQTPLTAAVESWIGTVVIATAISFVASMTIGRAYLDLHDAKTALERLSRTDPLTGLPNRRAFFEVAAKAPTEAMALIIADVDRFKRVNDTRGHLVGDEVLRAVSQTLQTELGAVGYVGRVGGEEFAVLGHGVALDEILTALNAVRKKIAATAILAGGEAVRVTLSAGIAVRRAGTSFDDLYIEADAALYRAKTSGRNRIHLAPSAEAALSAASDRDLRAWAEDLAEDSEFRRAASGE